MTFFELVVIVLVALVVIKPERAPEVAFFLGKTLARARVWYTEILAKYSHLP